MTSLPPHVAASSNPPAQRYGASAAPVPGTAQPWSLEDLTRYQRTLTHSVKLRSHLEILVWLQGDMQRYLPHDILLTAWGNFRTGNIQHDIVSIVSGLRSDMANDFIVTPLLMRLYAQWLEQGKKACVHSGNALDTLLVSSAKDHVLGAALRGMRCALTHGIKDERGSHDCLYVFFASHEDFDQVARDTLTQVLPYIDHALRQVEHLPHQNVSQDGVTPRFAQDHLLSTREREILQWIALGKTNDEIGSILDLSVYTVKNNVQRIFRKLNVSNRAQAVAVLTSNA
ncbi:MAG: transcriptional regulator EpsA [Rhodoferax sp.]|nr:transcriptional regulator EpsA [Rhodoferax sp.]